MKIIALTNRKGGVGKSTITVHLAAGLAARGCRVLVVDCDSQGQAAVLLGQPKADGLFALLTGNAAPEDVLVDVPAHHWTLDREPLGLLALLPSDQATALLHRHIDDRLVLAQALQYVGQHFGFDVILLDTPPSASEFDAALAAAADGMVFVTEPATLSLDGLREGLGNFDSFNDERQAVGSAPLRLLGVLPTRVRLNVGIHRRNLNNLARLPYPVWSPIRELPATWQEAAAMGVTVFAHRPESDAAKEARAAVDQFERSLAAWT